MRVSESPNASRHPLRMLAVVAVPTAIVLGLISPSSAVADESTSIVFGQSAQTVAFGSDWHETLTLTTQYGASLDEKDGTVDVYADGATTPLVGNIALFPGGKAYLTPDVTKTPLAAGTHTLTAIYRPGSGSAFATSQTVTPLTLTVTPLALTAAAQLDPNAASPTVLLTLTGDYVTALSTPVGEWTVLVTNSTGETVFSGKAAQTAGAADPVFVDMGSMLSPGDHVTITATFASPDATAGGALTQPKPLKLNIPALTLVQTISQPVPWWSLGVAGGLVLLAGAFLIIQAVRLRRARPAGPVTA